MLGVWTKTAVMSFDRAEHGKCSLSSLASACLSDIERAAFPKLYLVRHQVYACRCSWKALEERLLWSNKLGEIFYIVSSF